MKRSIDRNSTELQQIIADLDLNAQTGEMARAIYRKGRASHSDELRDARKVLFYAQAEVKRLEKLQTAPSSFGQQNMIDPADVEPASAIDDSSERMQAIGQNGNGGEHYATDSPWDGAPQWAKHAAMTSSGTWLYYEFRPSSVADIFSR